MRRSIRLFGGTVARVQGDGLFAIFGAPDSHGDTPLRACAAARDMLQRFEGKDALRTPQGADVHIRVGIATGHVLFRDIINDAGAAYDAVGKTAHFASHLEALAPANTVLCDSLTAELAQNAFALQPIDPADRGKLPADEALYQVDAIRTADILVSGFANRPIFGRDDERVALTERLQAPATDGGGLIAVCGAAGSGKTAVCEAVLSDLRAHGRNCLATTANRYARHAPYQCFSDWLRQLVQWRLPAVTGPEGFARWLRENFDDLPDTVAEQIVAIAFADAVPAGTSLAPALSAEAMRRALVRVSRTLIGKAPITLFLDDAQWADAASLAALERLVEASGQAALLATREADALAGQAHAIDTVELTPLSEEAVRRWLRFELGEAFPLDERLVSMVCALEGSAIVVQQLANAPDLIDNLGPFTAEHDLAAQDNRSGAGHEDLHPVLEFVIGERFDRLSRRAYDLLQKAAMIGMSGRVAVLRALDGEPEDSFDDAVAELGQAGILSRRVTANGLTFDVAHSTLQRLAYNRVPRAERRPLHARIHALLAEERLAGRAAEPVLVAHHARLGGLFEAASREFAAGATRAGLRGAYVDAGALIGQAQACIDDLEDDESARHRSLVEIAPVALATLVNLGRREESRDLLASAWKAALALDDPLAQARVGAARAVGLWKGGRHRDAIRDALAIMRTGERLSRPSIWALGLSRFLPPAVDLGLYDLCAGAAPLWLLRLRELAVEDVSTFGGLHTIAASFAARAALETGDVALGERILERAGMRADLPARDFGSVSLLLGSAQIERRRGRAERAVALCQQARAWCLDCGIANLRGVTAAWLASALVYRGDTAQARSVLEADSAFGEPEVAGIYAAGHFLTARALLALAEGSLPEARQSTEQALTLSRQHGEAGNEARALLLRSCLAWLDPQASPEAFAEDLRAARRLAEPRRMLATLDSLAVLQRAGRQRWPGTVPGFDSAGPPDGSEAPHLADGDAQTGLDDDILSRNPAGLFRHIVLN